MRAPRIIPEQVAYLHRQRRLPDSNRSKVPEEPQRLSCKPWLSRFSTPARVPERAACNTLSNRQAALLAVLSVCAYAAAWVGWKTG